MTPKKLVKAFYESDLANNLSALSEFLHPDCLLHWNNSKGFSLLNKNEIIELFEDINSSYHSMRMQISHMLQDGNFVTTRYTMFVTPIETPEDELALAHFITIWEVKDGKLFKGHEISQTAVDTAACRKSFSEIKV